MSGEIQRLQRAILYEYAVEVGLDPDAHYLGGASLRPLPPLDTHVGGLMILGAYPSARFATVDGTRDVPVGDNLGPFEPERYFDGDRVWTQKSADELQTLFLQPWRVSRSACWVTDLVKVFLFKEGHRDKYASLGTRSPEGYQRESFGIWPRGHCRGSSANCRTPGRRSSSPSAPRSRASSGESPANQLATPCSART